VERCEECGYDYGRLSRDELPSALIDLGATLAARLGRQPAHRLRRHAVPGVWSTLEYGCHVRDLLRVQTQRVAQAQAEDQPAFESMRREERVAEERYNEQDPGVVAGEIAEAARAMADGLRGLATAGWARSGVYNWPTREIRTVEWIGRHTVHEEQHHLLDIDRLLAAR
jgi:hypothetical protein